MNAGSTALRPIRSFVRREGRMTVGQQLALDTLLPRLGLDPTRALDPVAVFGRRAPLTFEIGFGVGDYLLARLLAECPLARAEWERDRFWDWLKWQEHRHEDIAARVEEAGVELSESGHIVVDRVSRTSVRGVYAAGDCTGVFALASVAAMQGRIAMSHALGDAVAPLRLGAVSANVFTDPEIATVGMTAEQAEENADVDAVTTIEAPSRSDGRTAPSSRNGPRTRS